MRLCLLFIGFSMACAGQESRGIETAAHSQRKALVIGNKNYLGQPLANTLNDANDMADALRKLDFIVDLATDLSKDKIESRATRFAQGLRSGDVAWFYYSGHGFQIDGENYLVPIEFRAASAAEARDSGVAFGRIKSAIEKSPAQLSIIVLDSCRNNPFAATSRMHGMALLEAGLGVYIAFAASPGQIAMENLQERNGLFTGRLLQALKQPLTVSELFRRVREEVYTASNHKQLPYIHDQVIADLYLRVPLPAPAAGSSDSPSMANALFEEGKNLYSNGRCKEALGKLDHVARTDPTNAYVQNALGLTYVCLNMPSRAQEHFSRAIDIQPGYAAAYRNRGQVFIELDQFQFAIDDFNWALEQEPENGSLYWHRGEAKFGLRRYEEAQKDFTASILRDPNSPYAYHWRGRVLYEMGKDREALADFERAIERKHDLADAIEYQRRTLKRLDQAR